MRTPFFLLPLLLSIIPSVEARTLSARDIVQIVLEKNLEVKRARLRSDVAEEGIRQSKGIFDTALQLEVGHNVDRSARTSTFFGNRTDTTVWDIGLSKKLPTGTTSGLSFNNQRQETFGAATVGGVPIVPTAPLYEPTLEFFITQSILQNAIGLDDRRLVKSARLAYEASDFQTRHDIQGLLLRSLVDYWTLLFTQEQLAAVRQSVGDARNFLNTTKEKERLGTAETTDALAAEANLLRREGEELEVVTLVDRAEEKLRDDLAWDAQEEFDVEDDHTVVAAKESSVEDRIALALLKRSDYQSVKRELERSRVQLQMAKMSRWPKLDLTGTLALNEIDASYSTAVGGMNNTNWTVGMGLQFPLENRIARAKARQADVKKASAVFQLKALELAIVNEVTQLHQEVESRRAMVKKLSQAERLEEEKLRRELQKYRQGRSSAELMIRFQDEFLQARRRAIDAKQGYVTSVYRLARAEGTMIASE